MPQKCCLLYVYHSTHLLKLPMTTNGRERLNNRGDKERQVHGGGRGLCCGRCQFVPFSGQIYLYNAVVTAGNQNG